MNQLAEMFSSFLPSHNVLADDLSLKSYGTDTSKNFSGKASVVLLPRTTEEVQKIVRTCIEQKLPIVPSGGRTGLAGAATATQGEVVVSLQRMNKILQVHREDRAVSTEAGVTTLQLKEAVQEHGLEFPVSLASWGTSQIGGNIATNAGGIHVIRYGHIRNWVLGLTVVTGKGDIIRTGRPLRKDNSGYDLKSLFIGSEGTLGIITEAVLGLAPKPPGLLRILCGLESNTATIPLLGRCHAHFPELSAFEFFSDRALRHVTHYRKLKNPFQTIYPCYALVELETEIERSEEAVNTFFMELLEQGAITDVVVAQNSKQSDEIMKLRESISETLSSEFTPHKNDISVPVSMIPTFIEQLEELMGREAPNYELVLFGHVGDGNIHLNWLKPQEESRERFFSRSKELDLEVLKIATSLGGSVSAEHGIGLLKKDVLHLCRSELEVEYMRGIKKVLDPHGLMNPGKIFTTLET